MRKYFYTFELTKDHEHILENAEYGDPIFLMNVNDKEEVCFVIMTKNDYDQMLLDQMSFKKITDIKMKIK